MVKVAVAGGTGGIGLHIVEAIVEAGTHEVIVLSRKADVPALKRLRVPVHAVSYDDPDSLTSALAGVHTVISTINGIDEETMTHPQLALLDAAVKAGVKRFAPSEFSCKSIPDNPIELYRLKWPVSEAVMASGLEYTFFENGIFMNYLASGTEGVGHLHPLKFIFDVENCKATMLGDGSAEVVLTRAEDIGKFVEASLSLTSWPEVSQMRGDRMSLNEILKLAEAVRGRKFGVTYLTEADLKKTISEHPGSTFSVEKFWAQAFLDILTENHLGFEGKNLNDLCPQVQPVQAEEFLRRWWTE